LNAIAMLSYDTLESTVTIASVRTPLGPMHVAALPSGVCAAVFDDRYQALEPRLRRMFGPYFSVSVGDPLDVARRIDAYFGGTLDALRAVPLAIAATPMQRRVWALVSALSPGALVTYAALADRLGMPRAQKSRRRLPCNESGAALQPVPPRRRCIGEPRELSRWCRAETVAAAPREGRRCRRSHRTTGLACAARAGSARDGGRRRVAAHGRLKQFRYVRAARGG